MEDSPKTTKKNDEDKLSNLPEPLIHHILSFLDIRYVVQTSTLSRSWRYFWTSIPVLTFSSQHFDSDTIISFEVFVDKVLMLRHRSADIHRFTLSLSRSEDHCVSVIPWILKALRMDVQELILEDFSDNGEFKLPNDLFACESLRILELKPRYYSLTLPDSMSLPRLKTLVLRNVEFSGDNIFHKMFSSCPVLESLILLTCRFDQTNVNICALKLKHLVIEIYNDEYDFTVKIYAPNLVSFRCKDNISTCYFIENDLSALVQADIDIRTNEEHLDGHEEALQFDPKEVSMTMKFLGALHNVEALTLSATYLEVVSGSLALLESTPIHLHFHNLRCLKLRTCVSVKRIYAITFLLKSSPYIESLLLEVDETAYKKKKPEYGYCDEVRSNSANVEVYRKAGLSLQCMLYHLKLVQIRGVEGSLNELMFLELLLKNSMVLEKLVLHSFKKQPSHTKSRLITFHHQLLRLPRASSSIAISLL